MDQRKEKRTWLAVVLAIPVVGFGHLYLRRWLRAVGWILLTFGASMFVPPEQLEALSAWQQALFTTGSVSGVTAPEFSALAPVLAVALMSIADAYMVARRHNAQVRMQAATMAAMDGDVADADVVTCPACGREVEADLDFCHWCTTEFERPQD
ncbi:hypothetical protein SAMN04487949_3597 [Halogranum gelatinilyticum]|uniref:DUF7575 domain-containing protein n=1 Tax=Halogranum gelatinilyticum TaxID=660521 RepID=A0A1G9ZCD6_9EURY|nr:TM2 domain-containing protein [Halogranum gelatinilyticum]SDN18825.1 hypothetical protein SAMN04487949_3597 [Halogranum gelatinilyticum]